MKYNNLFSLKNKTIVIAGGAGQIGFEIVKGCVAAGANVIIADFDSDMASNKLNKSKIKNVKIHKLDVTKIDSIKKFKKSITVKIDGLINCFHFKGNSRKLDTNSSFFSDFSNYPIEAWDEVHNVNLRGVFLLSQSLIPLFNNDASIINFSSTYGIVSADKSIYGDSGINSPVAYATSKSGIINLSRYMANHIEGVRVNTLSPGGVYNKQDENFVSAYSNKTSLGRMSTASEYVGPCIFLLSEASSYMTGSNLIVDGGWTSK